MNVTEENYAKIISIMRNYASISEGVNRDFITLAIFKAQAIISGDYWDVEAGQLMLEFIGNTLVQIKNHKVLYDYEKDHLTEVIDEMMNQAALKTLDYMNQGDNKVIETFYF